MRFMSIVGARPQFIKLAPVSRALRRSHQEIIVHTGQHYDERLSGAFFDELGIPEPDYNLAIGSGGHGLQTGRMLEALEEVMLRERPDGVIVFGDTNSTLAGALAASKLHISIAHVEAGLRSYNRAMPEEINRVVTDHLSDRLYCPTENARIQAAREGLIDGVEVVGDVMYDVVLHVRPRIDEHCRTLLAELDVAPGGYLAATIHRPANTDDPVAMSRIAQALGEQPLPVIFPMHPRTRNLLAQSNLSWPTQVHVVEPLGHLDMLSLAKGARFVVTDSGGLQKEAFLLGTPCITLRNETEWPETLDGGWNVLVGSDASAIVAALTRPQPEPLIHNPYGTGDAAMRIVDSLNKWIMMRGTSLSGGPAYRRST